MLNKTVSCTVTAVTIMALPAEQDCYVFLFCEYKSLTAVYYFEQEQTHILDRQYYMWHVQAFYRQLVSAVCLEQLHVTRERVQHGFICFIYFFAEEVLCP